MGHLASSRGFCDKPVLFFHLAYVYPFSCNHYSETLYINDISQRGFSPFVYRDRGGLPASLPYIRKIRVSVAIGTQSGIRLHERVPMVKIWGSSKNDQNWTTGKLLNL